MSIKIEVRKFLPKNSILSIADTRTILNIKWYYGSCTLPKEIEFDEEMAWYLGLRHGDKAEKNKGIIGIGNTNLKVIKKVFEIFVDRFHTPIEKIKVELRYNNLNDLKIVKSFIKNLGIKDKNIKKLYHRYSNHTVISLFAYNIVLHRLLDWLQKNIDEILLRSQITVSYAYHAGYFDADGHVDKTSNCFSWRTIDLNDAYLECKLLQNLGFNSIVQKLWEKDLGKYSFEIKIGNKQNIRTNDFNLFKNIVPFLVHSKKTIECEELLNDNRIRKLDTDKYLPLILNSFKNEPFKRKDFCKIADISKPTACRILKAFKTEGLIDVFKGNRVRSNGKLNGQEPDIYTINSSLVADFLNISSSNSRSVL